MRVRINVVVLSTAIAMILMVLAVPLAAQFGRPTQRAGLTVWADVEYRGANHSFVNDSPDISSTGMARSISSLQAASGESWQVCSDVYYRGRCRVFSGAVPNLQEIDWNDMIMSVRRAENINSQSGGYGQYGNPVGLEVYSGRNFTGRRYVLQQATADFRQFEFNDRPMSLRVPAGQSWEVCVHVDFDQCRTVTGEIPDLNDIGLMRMISSARPRGSGSAWGSPGNNGRGRGWARGQQSPVIVLFERPNYSGRSVTYETEQDSLALFSTLTGSLQVRGGRWQLCDRPQFGGNCVMVSGDVPDLANLGLRSRVASLRPR